VILGLYILNLEMVMQLYCDGAYSKKPKSAGVGVSFVFNGHQYDLSLGVEPDDSNLVEMKAVSCALSFFKESVGEKVAKGMDVVVVTDSDFVVRAADENTEKWKSVSNGFSSFKTVKLRVVKGHKGGRSYDSMVNEHVDRLAKKAMRAQQLRT
jgi:ribonuclease HI